MQTDKEKVETAVGLINALEERVLRLETRLAFHRDALHQLHDREGSHGAQIRKLFHEAAELRKGTATATGDPWSQL